MKQNHESEILLFLNEEGLNLVEEKANLSNNQRVQMIDKKKKNTDKKVK